MALVNLSALKWGKKEEEHIITVYTALCIPALPCVNVLFTFSAFGLFAWEEEAIGEKTGPL